jgi:hypothetical protein
VGTDGAAYLQMSWVNNHCGWAGGVNSSATENGAYRFIGLLRPPLPAPVNLQAVVTGHDVNLTWEPPASGSTAFNGYNMYRNGLKLNSVPIIALTYPDQNVLSGQYTYCVKAIYPEGESEGNCKMVDVAVGIGQNGSKQPKVFPNPATDQITIMDSPGGTYEVFDITGKKIMTGTSLNSDHTIDITRLPSGLYVLRFQDNGLKITWLKEK